MTEQRTGFLSPAPRFLKLPSGRFINVDAVLEAHNFNNAMVLVMAGEREFDLYSADRDAVLAWLDLNSEAI